MLNNLLARYSRAGARSHMLPQVSQRCFGTHSILLHSSWLQDVKVSLDHQSIGFPMNANKAKITPLIHPHQFYDELIASITRAKKSISLTALYLGTGEHERRLLLALDNALQIHPSLTVQLIFDGCRSKRPSPQGTTTLSVIQPLIEKYGERVILSLFSLPANKNTLLPSPADEVLGVFHMKVFVMDDEIIISGGNLSTEYFVDRQDRYIHFGDAAPLASYYREFIMKVAGCGEVVSGNVKPSSWNEINKMITSSHDGVLSSSINSSKIAREKMDNIIDNDDIIDTWIYPTLQCAPHGIQQDEEMLQTLLIHSSNENIKNVNLSTAYLNPSNEFMKLFSTCAPKGKINILTAHASSHGFKTAKGVMSLIPLCYQHLLCNHIYPTFMRLRNKYLIENHYDIELSNFNLLAYKRDFWTFHTKGLWIFERDNSDKNNNNNNNNNNNDKDIENKDNHEEIKELLDITSVATIVGSSNYGKRSYNKDLEVQLIILTENKELMFKLENEWNLLEKETVKCDTNTGFSMLDKIKASLTSIGMGGYL